MCRMSFTHCDLCRKQLKKNTTYVFSYESPQGDSYSTAGFLMCWPCFAPYKDGYDERHIKRKAEHEALQEKLNADITSRSVRPPYTIHSPEGRS